MRADTAVYRLIDQLSTGVAVLDHADILLHANPVLIDAAGLTGWRQRPLASIDFVTEELAGLPARARREGVTLSLRGVDLPTSASPLRCVVAVSPLAYGVLLELHMLALHEPAGSSPRISHSLRGLAHEIKIPLAGLRGAAQLLQRRIADPDLQRLAGMVITEADRLTH